MGGGGEPERRRTSAVWAGFDDWLLQDVGVVGVEGVVGWVCGPGGRGLGRGGRKLEDGTEVVVEDGWGLVFWGGVVGAAMEELEDSEGEFDDITGPGLAIANIFVDPDDWKMEMPEGSGNGGLADAIGGNGIPEAISPLLDLLLSGPV